MSNLNKDVPSQAQIGIKEKDALLMIGVKIK